VREGSAREEGRAKVQAQRIPAAAHHHELRHRRRGRARVKARFPARQGLEEAAVVVLAVGSTVEEAPGAELFHQQVRAAKIDVPVGVTLRK
jgi:hypothetical protein